MRAFAVRALAAGLCVAAGAAIAALAVGEFDETHWRIIATSLGFSVASALAVAGEALRRRRGGGRLEVLGAATSTAAIVGYLLLLALIWTDASEGLGRAFGVVALAALWGSHASIVLAARQPGDTPLIGWLGVASIAAGSFDTLVGQVALLGVVDEVNDDVVRIVGAVLVLLLLTTALPPILRRVTVRTADDRHELSPVELADALTDAARRLERFAVTDDRLRPEAEALRLLARRVPR